MTVESIGAGIAGVGVLGGVLRILSVAWRWRRALGAIAMLIEEYKAAKAPDSDGGSKITGFESEYLIQRITEIVTEGIRAKTPPPQDVVENSPIPLESDKETQ